jgi:hypothetical protein
MTDQSQYQVVCASDDVGAGHTVLPLDSVLTVPSVAKPSSHVHRGKHLQWKDLTFNVGKKRILNCWGEV